MKLKSKHTVYKIPIITTAPRNHSHQIRYSRILSNGYKWLSSSKRSIIFGNILHKINAGDVIFHCLPLGIVSNYYNIYLYNASIRGKIIKALHTAYNLNDVVHDSHYSGEDGSLVTKVWNKLAENRSTVFILF